MAEWFFSLGLINMWSLFLETVGLLAACRLLVVEILLGKIFFALFLEQTCAHYLFNGLLASFVANRLALEIQSGLLLIGSWRCGSWLARHGGAGDRSRRARCRSAMRVGRRRRRLEGRWWREGRRWEV